MPRPEGPLHATADRMESAMRSAILAALADLRGGIGLERLAYALHARNVKAAMASIPEPAARAVLARAKAILKEAFNRGGKIGAAELNKVLP